MKNPIFLLLIIFFLSSCYKETADFTIKEKMASELQKIVSGYCPLNQTLDKNQSWHIGTIYYADFTHDLSYKDEELIANIAKLQVKCLNQILILGNSSNYEASSIADSLELSFLRAKKVAAMFSRNKIDDAYLNINFCNNNVNRVKENSELLTARKYNQRVEIIFTNATSHSQKASSSDIMDCLP
ncbi:hypothetical protein ABSA28_00773 [Candidatus Hepatincolaceae symbiont of Richtersius coronifer]